MEKNIDYSYSPPQNPYLASLSSLPPLQLEISNINPSDALGPCSPLPPLHLKKKNRNKKVMCANCGKPQRSDNLSRHLKSCKKIQPENEIEINKEENIEKKQCIATKSTDRKPQRAYESKRRKKRARRRIKKM